MSSELKPVADESLIRDREADWNAFTSASTFVVCGVVTALILMAIFLV